MLGVHNLTGVQWSGFKNDMSIFEQKPWKVTILEQLLTNGGPFKMEHRISRLLIGKTMQLLRLPCHITHPGIYNVGGPQPNWCAMECLQK